jgi:L-lactate dehydrogenase complex protein LldE
MPATGQSVVRLLDYLGIPFVYHTEQTCCGLPAFNAGCIPEARQVAKHFIEVFGEDAVILSLSGSCIRMIQSHYPEILADEPAWKERAELLSGRVYELTQYLVDVLGIDRIHGRLEAKIAFHESCSMLRGLGISEQPKRLISSLEGAELVEMEQADVCCGFGGEFSHAYHEISEQMVADKAGHFLKSGADILTTGEPGCYLNIAGYMARHYPDKRVLHVADLLAQAL